MEERVKDSECPEKKKSKELQKSSTHTHARTHAHTHCCMAMNHGMIIKLHCKDMSI